ncbi:hypothetical protein RMDY18_12890 [Rothia mucilaginosa DY-18]|uniref:Uncharacterized protein n=1 Tax=Rothia mucilaginosa (strain DY-18) TaxID=680646 RepID=D2NTZ5_ROTMD|nr:hypothetical protein RMDY18_12890 [Rothia mucilaginosa DY-18]
MVENINHSEKLARQVQGLQGSVSFQHLFHLAQ